MKKLQMLLMASLMSCLGHELPSSECNRLYLYPEISLRKIRPPKVTIPIEGPLRDTPSFGIAGTIVTVVQADCPVCIQELQGWKSFLEQYPLPEDVAMCVIAIGGASEYFLYQAAKMDLPFNILLDDKGAFITSNDIPEIVGEHTFILDETMQPVFVGSPVLNPHCTDAFIINIQKMTAK